MRGQLHLHPGALTWRAAQSNAAIMVFHDLLRNREPEPSSVQLARKEGVENLREFVSGHALAIVRDLDAGKRLRALMFTNACTNPHLATHRECLDGIEKKIHQDLQHLLRVGGDRRGLGITVAVIGRIRSSDDLDAGFPRLALYQ